MPRGIFRARFILVKGVIERDIGRRFRTRRRRLFCIAVAGSGRALAADNIQKMGYTNVISMDGGWRGWTEANEPIEEVDGRL